MKIFSKTLIAAGIGLGMAFSASAGTYEHNEKQYKININGNDVVASMCDLKEGKVEKGSCREGEAKVDALSERLTTRITEAEELLSKTDALIADVKKKVAASDEKNRINDPASGKTYVLVKVAEGFHLPMDMELVKADDFSLVEEALKANLGRYKRALSYLESGKLPADKKTDSYGEISDMIELQNVVEFSEAI